VSGANHWLGDVTPLSRRRHAGLSKLNSMRAVSARPWGRPYGLPGPVDMSSGRSRSIDGRRNSYRARAAAIRRSVP
jgi:hypothetical protein